MDFWLRVPGDWRRPDVQQEFNLYWSREARFGQVFPRPSQAEIESFYEVDYYTHDNQLRSDGARSHSFWERLLEHLAWRLDYGLDITAKSLTKLVPSQSHPRVLEIGCGDGKLLATLQAAGWHAIGIEPDPAARNVASRRGLEVHDGTAEAPPNSIRGEQFDLVVMQHVLEHCLDPLKALYFAKSCLKPGAAIVIETPNNAAIGARMAGIAWPWLDVPRHLNFFTERSLREICTLAHLNPVSVEFTGYTRQFQSFWKENEKLICSTFNEHQNHYTAATSIERWMLLLRTGFARAASKYDSVRIVARSSGPA